ncbi:Uncharacterised protein [Mycobacteroides abscessus subsp. abscessus]|nr:Uncharacterised protein [Mycobacteroides abscessus subsp. bolletii]SKU77751.1 Uncharacterised protein [Mycobacteroides abscessus subsp. abscessus]
MYSPFGLVTRPFMPARLRTWVIFPVAPDLGSKVIGLSAG